MPITLVSRWTGPDDLSIARDAVPVLKKHGATEVRISTLATGPFTGQLLYALTYPDWTTYGSAMQGMSEDPEFKAHLKRSADAGFVRQDRAILVTEIL
jgi:hypothetical protein